MKKNMLIVTLLWSMVTPLWPAEDRPPEQKETFFNTPSNNLILAAGSTGLMLGLGSLAHYYYRQMRQSENMLALATLQKQQAHTDVEHEIADQRMTTHLKQRNRARNMVICLLIPTVLSGGSAAAFAGRGMWLMP